MSIQFEALVSGNWIGLALVHEPEDLAAALVAMAARDGSEVGREIAEFIWSEGRRRDVVTFLRAIAAEIEAGASDAS